MRHSGLVRELTLRTAVELALRNNLDIAIENYTQDFNHWKIQGLQGFYDPIVRMSSNFTGTTSPITSVLHTGVGLAKEKLGQTAFSPSVQKNLANGGSVTMGVSTNRATSNDLFTFVNPIYGSGLTFSWNQPLWRGYKNTQTEKQLKIFKLDEQISDSTFRQRVSEIVQHVKTQYWELVAAIESYETRRQSRDLAVIQYENTDERVKSGLESRFALSTARTEVAIRDQEMIQTELQISSAQNSLKRSLASGPTEAIWNATLLPKDRPSSAEMNLFLDEAVQTAFDHRAEIQQIRYQFEQSGIDRKFLENEKKPNVDLATNFGSVGQSGTAFRQLPGTIVGGLEIPGGREQDPSHPLAGGAFSSLGQLFGFGYRNWSIGVNAQFPMGNKSVKAQISEADIAQRRLGTQLKNEQLKILVEVRNAYEALNTQKKGIDAARAARQLSEEQLAGETERFREGLSTNFEVLRYQRDLGDARLRELRATIDYEIAMTALQKAMDVIVDQNDITIARGTK
jgi:outer membrane protein TolC